MISIAIVDDNKQACETIHKNVTELFQPKNLEYRTFCFNNAEHLLRNLNTTFNIILLDIDMPGLSGLETAKLLRKNNVNSIIIFITSQIKYMENAFGLNVFGFIIKDEIEKKLPEILNRCIEELNTNVCFDFKTNSGFIVVQRDDIIYATMEQRKVALFTIKDYYSLNLSKLNEFYDVIKKFDNFIYINRSTIVNLAYVTSITSDKLVVLKGVEMPIPMSKDKSAEVTHALLSWISKRSLI